MNHLVRTRSQHFVSSPRKTITPLKHKLARHASKRRRVGSTTAFAPSRAINVSEEEESDEDVLLPIAGPSRDRELILSEERYKGSSIVKKGRKEDKRDHRLNGLLSDSSVFASDENSPKKRKRGAVDDDKGDSDGGSSSWVEMDEDDDEEGEPEFIAESDQHLLQDAPVNALNRLRKSELIRLWKVAGMWSTEDEDDETSESISEEDEDGGISKKELVDGLIAARRHSAERASPVHSPRTSPKRKAALEAAFEIKRLRSASSSVNGVSGPVSVASSSDSDRQQKPTDTDATPRAVPRTRSKLRKSEAAVLRSVQRRNPNGQTPRINKAKGGLFRSRSKSMDGRKARFGDEVKSPAKGLLARRPRRSSTLSSAYTTTDNSPPENPLPSRQTPRRRRSNASRNITPLGRGKQAQSYRVGFDDEDGNEVLQVLSSDESSDDDAEPESTPLVQRLRSRSVRNSFVKEPSSELEADGEEESEFDGQSEASPVSQRLRSRDRTANSTSSSGLQRRNSRVLPDRGAKRKAIEALKGGESDDEAMELDDPLVAEPEEMDQDEDVLEDSGHREAYRTRSNSKADPFEVDDDSADEKSSSLTSTSPTPEPDPIVTDEVADDVRFTRSGKAFGQWQTRKNRLRQEAIDDPDMESYDETDEDDEDDEPFEADIDLADATHSSLIRLLRDELVQMCEARGIEVGGTKPQLAKALLDWRDEQLSGDQRSTTSSQATAKPKSSRRNKNVIHAVAPNIHVSGKTTPVLLRDHIHVTDPATPPHSDESKRTGEAELNLDLSELGLEDSMIKPSQLQKLEKIGSGGFKDVYVGKFRGRRVAISEFREHLGEMDIRELKLLAEFSHPNIVKFRGICIPEDNSQVPCMLVSELCENGDLFDYIRNVSCPSHKRVLQIMLDIARGLEYLHTRKPSIIHRDCKSSNILINRAGVAKVGDFGLARVKHSTRSMIRSLVGTVNWQAPELWHPTPRYDYKVDVFSAALVFWEMLSGWIGEKKYPWEGHNEHYIYDVVGHKHRRPSIAGLRKYWGDEPVNLMERMWHQDPGERPTMTDVVSDLEVLVAEA